jgi:trigger factor
MEGFRKMTNERNPQAQFEQISPTQYKIEVVVPPEKVQEKLDFAYTELSKSASIPGFRPGHAPRGILNRMFGKDRIVKEMTDEVVEDTFWPAIKQYEFTIVGKPQITPGEMHEGEDFHYTALVEVLPPIPELKFDDIKITLPTHEVTDEVIAEEMRSLQIRLATQSSVTDRPAADDDFVEVDFESEVPDVMVNTLEGEVPWRYKESKLIIELGRGKALPGLEDALRGMVLEEIKDFDVVIPEDFQDPRVRGKKLTAKARLTGIKKLDLPELTDEFIVEKFGDAGIDNLEGLKNKIKEEVEKTYANIDERETIDQIESYLSRSIEFPLPEILVRASFADILDRTLSELQKKGKDIEKLMGPEDEAGLKIRKRAWFQAERMTRLRIILRELARKEGIRVTDENLANFIMMMAYRQGLKEKDIKLLFNDESFINDTREDLIRKQATNVILGKVSPVRVEMEKFKKLVEDAQLESMEFEEATIKTFEDPFEKLKRAHELEHAKEHELEQEHEHHEHEHRDHEHDHHEHDDHHHDHGNEHHDHEHHDHHHDQKGS